MSAKFLIPVRGGSKGVPGKNKRNLAGKPLIAYVIETILKEYASSNIWVATDDAELKSIALNFNVNVFDLNPQTGSETLDDVAYLFVNHLLRKSEIKEDDILLTVQATCPLLSVETIKNAYASFNENIKTVITAVDDRHLSWKIDSEQNFIPEYAERVNRQSLPPKFKESGGVIASRIKDIFETKTRVNSPIKILPISKNEGIDIDDFSDWISADYLLKRKKIFIKADSSIHIGMGHLYRSVTLAYELAQHDVKIFSNTSADKKLSAQFFDNPIYNFNEVNSDMAFVQICINEKPDLIIVDQLNTEKDYILSLKQSNAKVITFEDLGDGANEADLLISDLFKNINVSESKQLYGVDHALLNPSFEWVKANSVTSHEVNSILLIFGGTDPSNLTQKTLSALKKLKYSKNVILVQGLGKQNRVENLSEYDLKGEIYHNVKYMPELMKKADLAISSAGRTITELMSVGTPTLCMCQNKNEMLHTHANMAHGIYNIGLGSLIADEALAEHINFLIHNHEFRSLMHERQLASIKNRNNKKIIEKIESQLDLKLL